MPRKKQPKEDPLKLPLESNEPESKEKKLPSKQALLDHVGTRFEHLRGFADDLEIVKSILEMQEGKEAKIRLVKITIALEVLLASIDALADLRDHQVEYNLTRSIDSIPEDPTTIEGGRGTPLI